MGAATNKLVFYAQSTITVVSGQDTFCHHTKDVKNVKLVYIERKKKLNKLKKKGGERQT